jgi:hypothetical protein
LQTYNEILKYAKKQAMAKGKDTSQTWWNQYWFPIFAMEEGYYFVICSQEFKKKSPVFCYDYKDCNDIRPKYKYNNLTSMIQVITECYQVNAYQLIAGEYGEYLEEDYEKVESIRLKYNPNARGTYYDLILGETFYYPGF